MNRRKAIKLLGTGGLVAAIGGSAYWLTRVQEHPQLAVHTTLERLRRVNPDKLVVSGAWEVARVLNHLAQSIEFSMSGYPEMKSAAFQNTLGRLAFSVFQSRGRMTHGLDEIIPGEVVDPNAMSTKKALQNLIDTLHEFDTFEGPLQPHFAYGELDKAEYSLAHVMHINNHWEAFSLND